MIRAVKESDTLLAEPTGFKHPTRLQALQQSLTFLKRSTLVHQLPVAREAAIRVLEVGCLGGYTLDQFAHHFVNAQLVGLEHSADWLEQTRTCLEAFEHRIDLLGTPYTKESFPIKESFDVLLFSYQLSKSHVPWETQVQQAYEDLKPGGLMVVLDFHSVSNKLVTRQFKKNKRVVRTTLLEELQRRFAPLSLDIYKAYFGLWEYFSFVGIKPYGQQEV